MHLSKEVFWGVQQTDTLEAQLQISSCFPPTGWGKTKDLGPQNGSDKLSFVSLLASNWSVHEFHKVASDDMKHLERKAKKRHY